MPPSCFTFLWGWPVLKYFIQCSTWLIVYVISLSITSSKFIWIIACDNLPFLFKAAWHSTTHIYYILSTHCHCTPRTADVFLWTVNNSGMNMGVQITLRRAAFNDLGYVYLKVQVLECVVTYFFPKQLCHFKRVSGSLYSHQHLLFLVVSILTGVNCVVKNTWVSSLCTFFKW